MNVSFAVVKSFFCEIEGVGISRQVLGWVFVASQSAAVLNQGFYRCFGICG